MVCNYLSMPLSHKTLQKWPLEANFLRKNIEFSHIYMCGYYYESGPQYLTDYISIYNSTLYIYMYWDIIKDSQIYLLMVILINIEYKITGYNLINSLRPSDTFMHQ